MSYFSSYTGNGTQTDFTITFPYLRREHVFASVNGTPVSFTWLNNTLVRISPAPPSGAAVRIYRETGTEPEVVWQDGAALKAADLDASTKQAVYVAEEARGNAADAEALAASAVSQAQAAVTTSNQALQTAQDALNAVTGAGSVPGPLAGDIGRVLTATGVNTFGWREEVPRLRLSNAPTAADHATRKDYVDNTRVAKSGDTMTGSLILPNNSPAGFPALTFDGDTDTGIRRGWGDEVRITTGGSDRLVVANTLIQSNVNLVLPGDTTASFPAINFVGDTNTGIRRGLDDEVRIVTGGVDRFIFAYSFTQSNAPLQMSGYKIEGLAAGTAANEAVNKGQLDAAVAAGIAGPFTLSGSAVDITGLPNDIRQLWVLIRDANITSASSHLFVQLGTSGGIETTGYDAHGHIVGGSGAATTSTSGFLFYRQSNALRIRAGSMFFHRVGNTEWLATQTGSITDNSAQHLIGGGGTKTLGGALTQVRLTAGGSTFTAGTAWLMWRF